MIDMLERQLTRVTDRANAAEAEVVELKRKPLPLHTRAVNSVICMLVYLYNLMLTVVGYVLVTFGKAARAASITIFTAVITGGNGLLCMRTRNVLIFGMLATAVTLDVAPAPPMQEAGALAPRRFVYDALATAVPAPPLPGALVPRGFAFDVLGAAAPAPPLPGALAPHGFALDGLDVAAPAPPLPGALAPRGFDLDVLAVAAGALPSIGQAPQHFLSDNGASANITSSYHGELPGSRRPTEVPQGFKQGTGKLTCDTTFLARRDLAGTGRETVACTVMKWQHTDVTQFEIVSEGYLRDELGCSFVDQPDKPRRCTFPDGTVLALNMTATGLGFGRFIKPDLSRPPMLCPEAAAAIASIAANASPTYCWDDCCAALFGESSAAASYNLFSSNAERCAHCHLHRHTARSFHHAFVWSQHAAAPTDT